MSSVKHKILVLSGKGGVGKSTFTSLLARALAAQDTERNVGVLDIDVCGPSQPRVMGVVGEQVHMSGSGWSPVYVDENIAVMSIGFLLKGPEEAVIWRGPKKNQMIRQFLSDVDWGELEYLIIDTPPGTSDEHLAAATYLQGVNLDGAIVVTTPQEVALLDVRKEIDFCRKMKIPILGVVENMTAFVCPKCHTPSNIFPPNTGGAAKMAEEKSIRLLGRLPLDPRVARSCDEGLNPLTEFPDSPVVGAMEAVVRDLIASLPSSDAGAGDGDSMDTS